MLQDLSIECIDPVHALINWLKRLTNAMHAR